MIAGAILRTASRSLFWRRSTDGGHSFNNYAWTEEPFEAGGVFFGDYSGIAAYGGRVYGIWTEKPSPAPEVKDKPQKARTRRMLKKRNHNPRERS